LTSVWIGTRAAFQGLRPRVLAIGVGVSLVLMPAGAAAAVVTAHPVHPVTVVPNVVKPVPLPNPAPSPSQISPPNPAPAPSQISAPSDGQASAPAQEAGHPALSNRDRPALATESPPPSAGTPPYPFFDQRCNASCAREWATELIFDTYGASANMSVNPTLMNALRYYAVAAAANIAGELADERERAAKVKAALGPDAGNMPVDTSPASGIDDGDSGGEGGQASFDQTSGDATAGGDAGDGNDDVATNNDEQQGIPDGPLGSFLDGIVEGAQKKGSIVVEEEKATNTKQS